MIESGSDQIEVAERAYARFGYVPILVTLVTDEPQKPIRIPSLRLLCNLPPQSQAIQFDRVSPRSESLTHVLLESQ